MAEREIGKVTHYFGHAAVAAVTLTEALKVGDTIRVKGHTTDFTTTVDHLQIDHKDVPQAKPGDDVAVHVGQKAREHDVMFKVEA